MRHGHSAPLLFLWQFPHFMAIAWMYREDYARAGYLVLPRGESRGSFVICLTLLPLVVLIPVLLTPVLLGHTGRAYQVGAFLLGSIFLSSAHNWLFENRIQTPAACSWRRLFTCH